MDAHVNKVRAVNKRCHGLSIRGIAAGAVS